MIIDSYFQHFKPIQTPASVFIPLTWSTSSRQKLSVFRYIWGVAMTRALCCGKCRMFRVWNEIDRRQLLLTRDTTGQYNHHLKKQVRCYVNVEPKNLVCRGESHSGKHFLDVITNKSHWGRCLTKMNRKQKDYVPQQVGWDLWVDCSGHPPTHRETREPHAIANMKAAILNVSLMFKDECFWVPHGSLQWSHMILVVYRSLLTWLPAYDLMCLCHLKGTVS